MRDLCPVLAAGLQKSPTDNGSVVSLDPVKEVLECKSQSEGTAPLSKSPASCFRFMSSRPSPTLHSIDLLWHISGRDDPERLLRTAPGCQSVKLKKDNAEYSIAFGPQLFFNDYPAGYLFDANGAMIAWEASASDVSRHSDYSRLARMKAWGASPTLLR